MNYEDLKTFTWIIVESFDEHEVAALEQFADHFFKRIDAGEKLVLNPAAPLVLEALAKERGKSE